MTTLELGCGSAAISLYIANQLQATVHVSDINPAAIDGVNENAKRLDLDVATHISDLFDEIPLMSIDVLIINPPFFASKIESIDEYAFNAGDEYQYFKKLSNQLVDRAKMIQNTYMILTDKCDLDSIFACFPTPTFSILEVSRHQSHGEVHLIYSVAVA